MPSSFSSSVRGAVSLLLLFALTSFQTASAQLQGKWVCDLKTGRLDPHTTYQMECAGYLLFKADKTLESTCIDGFFPTGALWEIKDNTLILKDSDGQAFADFEIKKLEGSQLSLLRNGVTYLFKKE